MLRFLPAHLPGVLERVFYKGKPLVWWEEDSHFYTYPYLLVSAYNGINSKWQRDDNVKNKNALVVGDSGGFQNVTMNANLEPIKVLKWLEQNCNIGFILDMPPFEYTGEKVEKNIVGMDKFKKCLEITKSNVEQFVKYRSNNDMLLYNIIQGHNIERLNMWHKELDKFGLDGWATGGVKPIGDPLRQVVGSLFLYDKGLRKNLHILGASGYNVMPTFVYLSKYIQNMTFDSSAYSEGRQYYVFRMPFNPRFRIPFGSKERVNSYWKDIGMENLKVEKLPCFCEVCSQVNADKNISIEQFYAKGTLSSQISSFLSLHNLNIQNKYLEVLNSLVSNKVIFRDFVKSTMSNWERIFQSFDFIDTVIEEGFEKGFDKYKSEFDIKDNNPKLASLFQF